jgi:hypothetical protein
VLLTGTTIKVLQPPPTITSRLQLLIKQRPPVLGDRKTQEIMREIAGDQLIEAIVNTHQSIRATTTIVRKCPPPFVRIKRSSPQLLIVKTQDKVCVIISRH